jgi:hypothetical protein
VRRLALRQLTLARTHDRHHCEAYTDAAYKTDEAENKEDAAQLWDILHDHGHDGRASPIAKREVSA